MIMSRSHVVPLDCSKASHHGSIPRLETVANTKSVKVRNFLSKIFGKLPRVLHHSDSEPSLKDIKKLDGDYDSAFTARRMSIIHAGSEIEEWFHVPGNLNPADACTHGIQAHEVEK